jgi:iron complex outermembrane receptor protein
MKKMVPVLLIAVLGWCLPATAQEKEKGAAPETEALLFQEIPSVFAASKYEQKVTEAPSWVSLVTAEEIKKYGYRTLAEILQSLPGFYLTYDRLYTAVGVRGFGRPGDYNGRILLMVDGHRLNEPIYDTAAVGTEFPLDVDLIDRVEVIRGPSSSLYGTNALFAVVNVITRRGRNMKGLEASGEAASFDTYKGRISWGNKLKNQMEALVSASLYDTPGQRLYIKEFDAPETNGGVTSGTDYDKYYQGFMNLAYQHFTIQGLYGDRKKGLPNGTYGVNFNDPGSFAVDRRGYLDLTYDRMFGDRWLVKGRLYYDYYNYYGDYNYPEGEVWGDSARSQWIGGDLQVTRTFWDRHKITLGGEYRYHFDLDLQAYSKPPYQSYLNYSSTNAVFALYGQDEYRILKNLILNLGLRYDHYESFGDSVNPRMALIYSPFDRTTLKLIYGSAFRAPNLNELYYQDNVYKSNPDLKPEKILTYEAVLEQMLGEHFRLGLSGYYYNIKDLISQYEDPADGLLVYRNLDEVETYGADLELGGKWKNGIEGRISYSYQDSVNKQTNETLLNSPRHMVKALLTLPLWNNKVFAGLEGRYLSPRKTLAGADTGDVYVFNLNLLGRRLLPGLEISLGIYNVFDVAYGDPGSGEHPVDLIYQDGRTFRIKLTYNF